MRILYMPCQEISEGCLTILKELLPVCSRNCELDSNLRNDFIYATNQKKITRSVGVSSSAYQHKLASRSVLGALACCTNKTVWNQRSDRVVPSQPTAYVARRRMGIRPGGIGPAGSGCDVKHGSYARFLARKREPQLII